LGRNAKQHFVLICACCLKLLHTNAKFFNGFSNPVVSEKKQKKFDFKQKHLIAVFEHIFLNSSFLPQSLHLLFVDCD